MEVSMDQFQMIVLITSGALTLIAFSEKIRSILLKPFKWLFFRPHQEIRDTIEDKCVQLSNRIEEVSTRQEEKILEMNSMSKGLLAMLHDKVFQSCKYFLNKGSISCDELENLEYLYNGYAGMGGNGTCETLYNKVKELKITK